MRATTFAVRDLTAHGPDDYPDQEYDVVAFCTDGKARHSDDTFDSLVGAEAAAAKWREACDDLDQWTVTTVVPNVGAERQAKAGEASF